MRRFLNIPEVLIFLVSLWIALTCNLGYWRVIAANGPPGEWPGIVFLASFLLLTVGLISLVMLILAIGPATRIVLALALLIAATTGYFTANLGILFDTGMLVNVFETNRAEALELITFPVLSSIAALGVVPVIILLRTPLAKRRFTRALVYRGIAGVVALSLIAVPLFASQKEIFSVARNHRELRHMIAPLNVIAASYSYVRDSFESPTTFRTIAPDARHTSSASVGEHPAVHVLIIGETARAANFSLNGYGLHTNPELEQRTDVRFLEAASCGTATAVSLPCMFSLSRRSGFDRHESRNEDNLVDIIARSGYEVYWVDNGNGCKGICARVDYRDVHQSDMDGVCPDGECFDEILVNELEKILATVADDTFIVLHQLGSHGPAYFRRYPERFRIFRPDCRSPNFGDCTTDEISNAYDNTIAYTDHVIASAIEVLAKHADQLDASLIYVSDHGESLGEHNIFLHGMPYALAPDEQTKVPFVAWLSPALRSAQGLRPDCDPGAGSTPVSHDDLFHTELGLLGIDTAVYNPDLDIFASCRRLARPANTRALAIN